MRLLLRVLATLTPGLMLLPSARGDLHTWQINEIFSNSDGTIQYIELQERSNSNGQQNLATSLGFPNHTIASNTKSFLFPTNLPNNLTANKFFLVATPAYAALPGAVAPDFTLQPAQIPKFFDTLGDTITFAGTVDSFAFTGAQLPLNGHSALLDNLSIVENSPTNFAGQTGHILVPEPSTIVLAIMALAGLWATRRTHRARP